VRTTRAAIEEACRGWWTVDKGVSVSRDSHYQLVNRLAFAWKLATLGIPIVLVYLVYLGFTGDEGIRDAGVPFADPTEWNRAFAHYAAGVLPLALFERRLDLGPGCCREAAPSVNSRLRETPSTRDRTRHGAMEDSATWIVRKSDSKLFPENGIWGIGVGPQMPRKHWNDRATLSHKGQRSRRSS